MCLKIFILRVIAKELDHRELSCLGSEPREHYSGHSMDQAETPW